MEVSFEEKELLESIRNYYSKWSNLTTLENRPPSFGMA